MALPGKPATGKRKDRVFLVEDHPVTREGFAQLINYQNDLQVCGQTGTAAQALTKIPALSPDLVILDISLAGTSGVELIKDLTCRDPILRILVLSTHDETLYAERALRAGARGYVMKHEPGKSVITAIHKLLRGEMYLSERMSSAVISKFMRGEPDQPASPVDTLSDREMEVFRMLGRGMGTRQIAQDLGVTVATVNSFRNRIKEKMQLKSSTEVMLHAIQWVQDESGK